MAADYITRDMIPDGTDVSNIRCDGRVVSVGDLSTDVLQKCGEPIEKSVGRSSNQLGHWRLIKRYG